MQTLIHNIKAIVGCHAKEVLLVKGRGMKDLPILENAWLLMEDDRILNMGTGTPPEGTFEQIDAGNGFVFPTWVDSHTHIVYAGNREGEFVDRINGLTYEEIARRGGGILNSAAKLRLASEDELIEAALNRLTNVTKTGTGAVEIKSGYGLTIDAELKMLRVARKLAQLQPLPIRTTLLGAHALPLEYKGNKSGYIQLVCEEMIPRAAEEGLADYIDIFCEEGYFDVADTERVLEAGAKWGLKPKTHVNQFNAIGGVKASVERGAISVDHLEELEDDDIDVLIGSGTIATALPLCSLFLTIPYTPARRLIAAGVPVAIATDYNPGSSPSGNMSLAVALACMKMRMNPEEAINAATINGAAALEWSDQMGSMTLGKKASFFITREMTSYAYLPYSFGDNLISRVFVNGKLVATNS
ncbi:MAG: imidazolonepropionase [Flavobacteriales bacterium]|nr:imidazolonepropionase [Flavobacteriales bacterium]